MDFSKLSASPVACTRKHIPVWKSLSPASGTWALASTRAITAVSPSSSMSWSTFSSNRRSCSP